jgi:AcrR family transcriptional regulator
MHSVRFDAGKRYLYLKGVGVSRPSDPRRRTDLLDAIVDRVVAEGLADLSLRPLAAAVGSSPRMLLYHFGSKEALIGAVLAEASRRQVRLLETWWERSAEHDARTMLLRAWQWLTAPRHDRLLRLLFETYGLALVDRRRYAPYLRATAAGWVAPFARVLVAGGFSDERAASLATLLVAVVRGLLLDVLATGDRARVDRAFRSFIGAIEFPEDRESRERGAPR